MKEKILNILLPITWILILISCCFILAFTSHASDTDTNSLPVLVNSSNFVNSDGYSLSELQEFYDNRWGNVYPLDFSSIDNLIIYDTSENIGGVIYNFTLLFCPNVNYNNTYSFTLSHSYDSFNISSDTATLSLTNYFYIQFSNYSNEYNDPYLNPLYSYNISFFGTSRNEVKYINNALYYNADITKPVFVNAIPVTPAEIGTAIIPNFVNPDLDINTTFPNPPIWNTPSGAPTFDSTDIPGSIYSLIEWGLKDPNGPFQCLENNLHNAFEYLGDCIKSLGESIINNIQNAMTNLYENFKNLLEPIYNKIDYISQPVSGTVIYDNISGTTLIQSINTVDTALTTFQGTFTGLSEPNSFVIPIHLESLPSSLFGNQTTQYLDLSWINSDMRTLVRVFMWAIITYSLFITIVDSIANYINGGGDES